MGVLLDQALGVPLDADDVVAAGILDRAFARMASSFAGSIVLVTADDSARLAAALATGAGMDLR